MKIMALTEHFYEAYEKFIFQCKGGLFYYSLKYKGFLEELLNCESEYLLAVDHDQIKAILPLMKSSGKYGVVYNSLPFYGSHGGILSQDDAASALLIEEYHRLIESAQVGAATLIANPLESNDWVSSLDYDIVDNRIGQWTPLGLKNIEELEASFDSSARRNIRKANKSGIKIKVDNTQTGLDFLKQTHQGNMLTISGKAKSDEFFSLIPRYFEPTEDYNIYVAYLDEKPIAALLLFYFKDVVEYFTPATLETMRSYQPLALIIYQAMQEAMERDFKWWNWGGTWLTQDGVYKFKKKWGAIDKPYKYYTKINNPDLKHAAKQELLREYDNFFVLPFSFIEPEVN